MIKINPAYSDYFYDSYSYKYYRVIRGVELIFNKYSGEFEGIKLIYPPKNVNPDTLASITIDNLLRKGILELTD